MKGTALVFGDYQQTITVVRSLAQAGYRVLVARSGRLPYAALSRHVDGTWTHPDFDRPDAFAAALRAFCDRHQDLALVFPVGERDIAALAEARAALRPGVRVVMPSPETFALCADKPAANAAATAAGLPVPPMVIAARPVDIDAALEKVGTPAVVKCPDSSRMIGESKAIVVDDMGSLERWRDELRDAGGPLLVQRYAWGARHNCHFAAVDGRVVAYFEDRTLRCDRPDDTGFAVEGMSVPPTPSLRSHCEALAAELRYTGVGCAQFLVDTETGEQAFLELNPRLDATCELPYRCGIDFPRLAVQCAEGRIPEAAAPDSYPAGRRFHWLFGDLRGLVGGARRGRFGFGDGLRLLGDLTSSHWNADCRLIWSWSDPLPSWYFYGREIASGRPRLSDDEKRSAA